MPPVRMKLPSWTLRTRSTEGSKISVSEIVESRDHSRSVIGRTIDPEIEVLRVPRKAVRRDRKPADDQEPNLVLVEECKQVTDILPERLHDLL